VVALVAVLIGCAAPVPPATTPSPTFGTTVPCGPAERLERHAHAHLTIVIRGQLPPLPANIGITATQICWLHTHDTSGIIHIEAGDNRTFTLGDLFAVWRQPLGATVIDGDRVGSGESIQATVNQQPHSGAPETIVLKEHEDIVLQLGAPFLTVPPYVWPPGY